MNKGLTSDEIYRAPSDDSGGPSFRPPLISHDGFYVVSSRKFLILFGLTLGLYGVVWFYEHWRAHKNKTGDDVWPVARAVFSILFTHKLFALMRGSALDKGAEAYATSGQATTFVLLSLISSVLERVAEKSETLAGLSHVSTVLVLLSSIPLLLAQRAANIACGDEYGATNDAFTPANYFWSFLGVIIWSGYFFSLFADI